MKKGFHHKSFNKKGFTLAELLIVVAIIAVLVAISIPIFSKQLEKSRESTDLANLRNAYAEAACAAMTGEFTVTNANGDRTITYYWDGQGYAKDASGRNVTGAFCYDPGKGLLYSFSGVTGCGRGTAVDGGTKATFFGKGEYRGDVNFKGASIAVYFENDGTISVYYCWGNGNNAVIKH